MSYSALRVFAQHATLQHATQRVQMLKTQKMQQIEQQVQQQLPLLSKDGAKSILMPTEVPNALTRDFTGAFPSYIQTEIENIFSDSLELN